MSELGTAVAHKPTPPTPMAGSIDDALEALLRDGFISAAALRHVYHACHKYSLYNWIVEDGRLPAIYHGVTELNDRSWYTGLPVSNGFEVLIPLRPDECHFQLIVKTHAPSDEQMVIFTPLHNGYTNNQIANWIPAVLSPLTRSK